MTELVTGYAGTPHISSDESGRGWAGIVGVKEYVMDVASLLECAIESANSVSVAPGEAFMEGRHITVPTTEILTIDSGSQGMKRHDIVGFLYSKDAATSVETATLTVIKGTPATEPSDPTLPSGSILEGATEAFMPLWRVPLDGLAIQTPQKLFATVESLDDLTSGYIRVVRLANGSIVYDDSTNVQLQTTDDSTSQAQWAFYSDGRLYCRTRTRSTTSASWGAWSSWYGITAQELQGITIGSGFSAFEVSSNGTLTVADGLTRFVFTSDGNVRVETRESTSAAWATKGYAFVTNSTNSQPHYVMAGPASGSASAPVTMRKLVADDIPSIPASKITSGTLPLARGGTASNNTGRAINTVFAGPASGSAGNASWRKLVANDVPNIPASKITSGTLAAARLPSVAQFDQLKVDSYDATDGLFFVHSAGGYSSAMWANKDQVHMQGNEVLRTGQFEYSFEWGGIYIRRRSRSSPSAAWGDWSAWTKVSS